MSKKQQIRKTFRDNVFQRDRYCCRCCGKKGKDRQGGEGHLKFHKNVQNLVDLDSHHITDRNEFKNGGYVKENGISVCDDCHRKAEQWHITKGEQCEASFTPTELYKLIGSDVMAAHRADERNE